MNKAYEGFFITVEGGEGAGKSTLSKKIVEKLVAKGYKVHHAREPGGTPLSEKIRELLLHSKSEELRIGERAELLLFLAARAEHIEEVILPKLRLGYIVLCERFSDSTVAYQGCARHLGIQDVEKLCKLATGSLEPDCTFLLDVDPKEGLKRVQEVRKSEFDRVESERLQFHREVRQGFLHLADQYRERIVLLDGMLSEERVLERALEELEPRLFLKPTSLER